MMRRVLLMLATSALWGTAIVSVEHLWGAQPALWIAQSVVAFMIGWNFPTLGRPA